jgi:hypothetical protein
VRVVVIGVDEGVGFEFEGGGVDACGDFRGESVDEEGGGGGWVGEASAEESVVGVEGVLVWHGGARRQGNAGEERERLRNAGGERERQGNGRQGNAGKERV